MTADRIARKRVKEPKWVTDFFEAVYPEHTDLIRILATEKSILTDAVELIAELRKRVKELENANS